MSLSSKEIKFIKSLQQKKFRSETSLFVVEGEKLVSEALDSGFRIKALYRKTEIGEEAMARISSLSTPSPVLAVVEQMDWRGNSETKSSAGMCSVSPESQITGGDEIIVALDGVADPGNLGTIIRLCDWFGISSVLASMNCVELYNPKTVQATMGSVFRVPVIYGDLAAMIRERTEAGYELYGTLLDGKPVDSGVLRTIRNSGSRSIIVMGSESFGISEEIRTLIPAANRLLIPPYNPASHSESLNVAAATAIILSLLRLR